jgi:hypothetical protein
MDDIAEERSKSPLTEITAITPSSRLRYRAGVFATTFLQARPNERLDAEANPPRVELDGGSPIHGHRLNFSEPLKLFASMSEPCYFAG